ncbi:MAG: TGS domain-containing protein, partial [Candidatus Heimdallarchaeota archaeon]
KPLIMDKHSTIKDAAIKIHKSFYESFNHAILIREGARQKRKKVGLGYILNDMDIIELYTL